MFYEVNLTQVSKEVGYISGGVRSVDASKDVIAEINETSNINLLRKIIVEKTPNPYVVKEVITGIYFPVVYCGIVNVGKNNYMVLSQNTLPEKLNTFVKLFSRLDEKGKAKTEDINPYCVNAQEFKEYVWSHKDIKAYYKELMDIYRQGEENMKVKLEEEKEFRRKNNFFRKLFRL